MSVETYAGSLYCKGGLCWARVSVKSKSTLLRLRMLELDPANIPPFPAAGTSGFGEEGAGVALGARAAGRPFPPGSPSFILLTGSPVAWESYSLRPSFPPTGATSELLRPAHILCQGAASNEQHGPCPLASSQQVAGCMCLPNALSAEVWSAALVGSEAVLVF